MFKNKVIKIVLVCLLISIFLEVFVFNFRFFSSLGNKSVDLTDSVVYHKVKVKKGIVTVDDIENSYIEIKNIDKVAKNIKLNFSNVSGYGYLVYKIYATDEGNKNYYALPNRYLYPNIEKSKYVTLDLIGKVKDIKIMFDDNKNPFSFKLNGVSINEKVHIYISFTRLLLVFMMLFIIYIIRPKSEFYKYKIDFKNKSQVGIILGTVVCMALAFLYIVNISPVFKEASFNSSHDNNNNQYHYLSEAFAKGQVSLLIKPSKVLKSMKNPYDPTEREELSKKHGVFWAWDHCYYKGKYYVYFGVVPALLTYFPFYLITGTHLFNYVLSYIVMIIIVIGIALLLKEIVKRYFNNIPFILYLILLIFISFGSNFILQHPSVYTIPIAFSLMFTYFGLYFMISAIDEKKLNTFKIFLGSLCMSLVAGCRPQFLIGSFLLIPLFWKSVFVDRTLFSKKSIKQTLAFILPYIVIAVLIMYYNYIRFGSVVDFGVNYNVTTNDMTRRGFKLDRIGFGIFVSLFQFPVVNAIYPFLHSTSLVNNYMGITITEPNYGGLLITNLSLWLGIFFFKFKKYLPKVLYYLSFVSIIGGLLIMIFDVEASGIFPRYSLDYTWLFILPTIFVILGLFNGKLDKNIEKIVLTFVVVTIILNLFYQGLGLLDDKLFYDMINTNTRFYFKWYYLLQWWL